MVPRYGGHYERHVLSTLDTTCRIAGNLLLSVCLNWSDREKMETVKGPWKWRLAFTVMGIA